MFWAEILKRSDFFLSENFHFLVVEVSEYLNRHVFVMFYDRMNTIHQFIKTFFDNKMSIFEEYGAFYFLFYNEIVCCVYSLESPRRVHSTYHYFIWIILDRKDITKLSPLPPDLALWLTLNGLNYPCLEQISTVQKMFEPIEFNWNYSYPVTLKISISGSLATARNASTKIKIIFKNCL